MLYPADPGGEFGYVVAQPIAAANTQPGPSRLRGVPLLPPTTRPELDFIAASCSEGSTARHMHSVFGSSPSSRYSSMHSSEIAALGYTNADQAGTMSPNCTSSTTTDGEAVALPATAHQGSSDGPLFLQLSVQRIARGPPPMPAPATTGAKPTGRAASFGEKLSVAPLTTSSSRLRSVPTPCRNRPLIDSAGPSIGPSSSPTADPVQGKLAEPLPTGAAHRAGVPLVIWKDDATYMVSFLPFDASHQDALLATGLEAHQLVGRGLVLVCPALSQWPLVCVVGFCDPAWTTVLIGSDPLQVSLILHVRSDASGRQLQETVVATLGKLSYCGMDLADLDFVFDGMLLTPIQGLEEEKMSHRHTFPISLQSALCGHAICGSVTTAIEDVDRVCCTSPVPLSLHRATPKLGTAASEWLAEALWCPWQDVAQDVDEVTLYTDGSYINGKGAWAFVVFSRHPMKGWPFHGTAAAPSAQGLFQEHSELAFVSEAAALAAALSWALSVPRRCTVRLFFDCLSAGLAATGEWDIPRDRHGDPSRPHAIARNLFLLHQAMGTCLQAIHVHSHQGNPGNDLADQVARQAALDGAPLPVQDVRWFHTLSSPLGDWLWLLPSGYWHSSLPSLFEVLDGHAAADVDHSAPQSTLTQLPCHASPAHQDDFAVSLTFATFNVCSLRAPGLLDLLQSQMREHSVHVLGVQEARFPSTQVFQTASHMVATSASDATGNFGCALLIDHAHSYAQRGRHSLSLSRRQLHVILAEPRLLLCRLHAPALQVLCVVAHAPHSKQPLSDRERWWARLRAAISSALKPGDVIWAAIDANGRLGLTPSEACGTVGAEEMNANGEALLALSEEFDLLLPSTFDLHQGHHQTWSSPAGFEARIDYVACSRTLRHSWTKSWIAWTIGIVHFRWTFRWKDPVAAVPSTGMRSPWKPEQSSLSNSRPSVPLPGGFLWIPMRAT